MRRPWLVLLAAVAVSTAAAACSDTTEPEAEIAGEQPPAVPDEDPPTDPNGEPDDEPVAEPPPDPEPCPHDALEDDELVPLRATGVTELSLEVADRTHRCADVAVVAAADAAWAASIAAPAAAVLDAPLLLIGPDGPAAVAARIEALGAEQVVTVGVPGTGLPGTVTELGPGVEDPTALALEVASYLEVTRFLAIPTTDTLARAGALSRLDEQTAFLPVVDDAAALSDLAADLLPTARLQVVATNLDAAGELSSKLLGVGIDAVVATRPVFLSSATTTWLFDPDQPATTAIAAVAAAGRGEAILPIDPDDLRRGDTAPQRLRDARPRRVVTVGEITDDVTWQVPLLLRGSELPGGGFLLFEDRRMVALYGSPEHSVLGAMGQQSLDETLPRLREVAQPYAADGLDVLPAFEMIVTIASADAEETEDFSRRTDIEVLRPWVERAAEEDVYVILDLQPGRTDFLSQAQEYEELLLEPHVGLALDPEWRLEDDQMHLDQIGSVEAIEVQQVVDWLAALTRDNLLPEKLLILHQFQFGMLPDRDSIEVPSELAVVIHMDGQGSLNAKYETYAAITRGAEDRWLWGWKNFYDEDDPVATPAQVLALDPQPVFVSYQ